MASTRGRGDTDSYPDEPTLQLPCTIVYPLERVRGIAGRSGSHHYGALRYTRGIRRNRVGGCVQGTDRAAIDALYSGLTQLPSTPPARRGFSYATKFGSTDRGSRRRRCRARCERAGGTRSRRGILRNGFIHRWSARWRQRRPRRTRRRFHYRRRWPVLLHPGCRAHGRAVGHHGRALRRAGQAAQRRRRSRSRPGVSRRISSSSATC